MNNPLIGIILLIIWKPQVTWSSHLGCFQNGRFYEDGEKVKMKDGCLSCTCRRRALDCNLRVCSEPPAHIPPGCFILNKPEDCCPRYLCDKNYDEKEMEIVTVFKGNRSSGKNDCIVEGNLYSEGSALASPNPCEYCYCASGRVRCLKPRCVVPLDGCEPIYDKTSCCPTEFNCSKTFNGSEPLDLKSDEIHEEDCEKNGIIYKEGEMVSISKCETCYCMRGILRCAKFSCFAKTEFEHCRPLASENDCCPSAFLCDSERGRNKNKNESNWIKKIIKEAMKEKVGPDDGQKTESKGTDDEFGSTKSRFQIERRISVNRPTMTTIIKTKLADKNSEKKEKKQTEMEYYNYGDGKNRNIKNIGFDLRNVTSHFHGEMPTTPSETKSQIIVNGFKLITASDSDRSFALRSQKTPESKGKPEGLMTPGENISRRIYKDGVLKFYSTIDRAKPKNKNIDENFLEKTSSRKEEEIREEINRTRVKSKAEILGESSKRRWDFDRDFAMSTTSHRSVSTRPQQREFSTENLKARKERLNSGWAPDGIRVLDENPQPIENSDAKKSDFKDSNGSSQMKILIKLAGCNIYGKIYDVGESVTASSENPLRCTCTNGGVECEAPDSTKN